MRSETDTYFTWNFVFLSLTVRNHLPKLLMLVVLGILSTWFSSPFLFSLRESSPRHSGSGVWVGGEGKEEERATTSLELILNSTSNSPMVSHQLSCQISVNYHETETTANVNKHWKTRAKGNDVSSNTGYFITQPIRIEYFKHVTELTHSRPISVQDFMVVSTTCKTITKSLPTFPRHVRHTKSHVSTNFILTSYLALQSGRVWPPIDVTPISF